VAVSPALFIDKDGTLFEDVPYNVDPDRMVLVPGILRLLAAAQRARFKLVVVSNQSGVALGRIPREALYGLADVVCATLAASGIVLDDCYFCPHHPEGTVSEFRMLCLCRKPQPGMLQWAAREHGIDLRASWLVGDILDDVEAAHRAGARAILLDRGHETEWRMDALRMPDVVVSDPAQAIPALAWPRTREARVS
jgi:histidinol-phosphate phosphatase family protein